MWYNNLERGRETVKKRERGEKERETKREEKDRKRERKKEVCN